jgi:hypothetical protein
MRAGLYGAGVKTLVTDHIYVGAEAYQIDFSKENGVSADGHVNHSRPNMGYAGVMMGYKFSGNDRAQGLRASNPRAIIRAMSIM